MTESERMIEKENDREKEKERQKDKNSERETSHETLHIFPMANEQVTIEGGWLVEFQGNILLKLI